MRLCIYLFIFRLTFSHKSEICLISVYCDSTKLSTRARRNTCHSKCTPMVIFVIKKIWHLPGLTSIRLLVNQEKSLLAVNCNCLIMLGMSSAQENGAISSAISKSSNLNKRSIKSMLNSNGPKIEPCGTPYSILLLSL